MGKRKLLSGLVLLGVGVAVTLVKGDITPNLLQLMQLLYTAFIFGNGVEHVSKAVLEKAKVVKDE